METLLYSPELKFYSNRVKMDATLRTSVQNLHCLGDSSGWTRGPDDGLRDGRADGPPARGGKLTRAFPESKIAPALSVCRGDFICLLP